MALMNNNGNGNVVIIIMANAIMVMKQCINNNGLMVA